MQITIEYYAVLADRTGERSVVRTVPQGATVRTVVNELIREHEIVDSLQDALAIAVNDVWKPMDQPLQDGDVLALIPPVSGG
ncbi:MAG: MoaD/ThiS family protein [Phycisphaerales bacterium]|nr:MoaD/ThiS family protein [Phycisphaerales bacterium]